MVLVPLFQCHGRRTELMAEGAGKTAEVKSKHEGTQPDVVCRDCTASLHPSYAAGRNPFFKRS